MQTKIPDMEELIDENANEPGLISLPSSIHQARKNHILQENENYKLIMERLKQKGKTNEDQDFKTEGTD
jgi:hypothetical protein